MRADQQPRPMNRTGTGQASRESGEPDPLLSLARELRELQHHARLLLITQVDLVRARVRGLLARIAAALCGAVLLIAFTVYAWTYVVDGVAGGLSAAFNSDWLGSLLAGLLSLLALAAAVGIPTWKMSVNARRRRIMKYERLKAQQPRRRPTDAAKPIPRNVA
jgi:hypothetical protein